MARIKGASEADQAAHRIYDEIVLPRNHGGHCTRCGTELITAYHEERLYSVRCQKCETVTLVKAQDPYQAEAKVSSVLTADRFDMALALMVAFPGSFLYYNGEFIAHKKSNTYLNLRCCENEEDLKCRVLEFLSRAAHKTSPYKTARYNEEFHKFMLDGINKFLGTTFDMQDMDLIYTYLGNRCNHELTVQFVRSGYDMQLLYDRQRKEGPWA